MPLLTVLATILLIKLGFNVVARRFFDFLRIEETSLTCPKVALEGSLSSKEGLIAVDWIRSKEDTTRVDWIFWAGVASVGKGMSSEIRSPNSDKSSSTVGTSSSIPASVFDLNFEFSVR